MTNLKVKFAMGLILLLLLVGCQRTESSDQTIRIAHFPNVSHAQAIVGRKLGIFEEYFGEDVQIDYKLFNAGSSEIEAFFSDQIDIGYIGPIPAINGHIKSRGDIIIIAGVSNAGARLVAAKGSKISTIDDLNYKSIAIPQIGNTQHIALLHLLSLRGLSDESRGGLVNIVAVNNAQVMSRMKDGSLEAAFLPEPWATLLVHEGYGYFLEDEAIKQVVEKSNTAVVIVHKDFLESKPDLVMQFLEAHLSVTQYVQEHTGEASGIVRDFIETETGQKVSQDVIALSFEKLDFNINPMSESIMTYMQFFMDEGFITEFVEEEKLIQLELLNELLEALGHKRIQ